MDKDEELTSAFEPSALILDLIEIDLSRFAILTDPSVDEVGN